MATALAENPPNFRLWKACAWAGPVYVVGESLSWAGIGRFLPPPAEYWTALEVTQFYLDHNLSIRVGMMLTLMFAPLYYIWSVAVSRLMMRAEGSDHICSTVELLGGFATVIVTFGAVVPWLSCSFDTALKDPQDIKAMNDLGWMCFNPTALVTFFQFIAFGIAFLSDKRSQPLIPRWMAWFSFAMAFTLLLALLTPLFRTGPFAWHGLFTYYIGLGGYFLWIIVACYQVLRGVARLEAEYESA